MLVRPAGATVLFLAAFVARVLMLLNSFVVLLPDTTLSLLLLEPSVREEMGDEARDDVRDEPRESW